MLELGLRFGFALALWFGLCGSLRGQGAWTVLERPTSRDFNRVRFLDSTTGWIIGERGTILKTTNGGLHWTSAVPPSGADMSDIDMFSYTRGWVLGNEFSPDSSTFGSTLYLTADGGSEWAQVIHFDELVLSIEFVDSLVGVAGGIQGKIARTTDGGFTWYDTEIDSQGFMPWPVRHIEFLTPTYGYGVGGQRDLAGTMWRTTNGGLNWDPKMVTSEPIYAIYFFDSSNVICAGGDPDFGAGMARTSDGGINWGYEWIGFLSEVRGLAFRTAWEGWAPLGFSGTYMHTTDGGQSWVEIDTPNNAAVYDATFTDSLVGYMVGERGLIMKYVHPLVSVRDESAGPSEFVLEQNFPNPFNPTTTIPYDLPYRSDVSIAMYNALGQEVWRMTKEGQPPGHHRVKVDARSMASGVYFYRMVAQATAGRGIQTRTRKMVLLR